jgi:hypothetical protein
MRERRALENLQNQQVQQLQAQQLQMQQQQLQQQQQKQQQLLQQQNNKMNGESRDGFLLVLGFLVLALGVWGFLWGS